MKNLIRLMVIISCVLAMTLVGYAKPWNQVSSGLQYSFVLPDQHYAQDQVPDITVDTTWSTVAWKGERINHELLLWSKEDVENVSLQFSQLTGQGQNILPADTMKAYFLKYVLSDDGGAGCGNNQNRPTQLIADVLDTQSNQSIHASKVQPVWIRIDVPSNTVPDTYSGQMKIVHGNTEIPLTIQIEVLDMEFKAPLEWNYHLDLWQNPWSVARYHNVEPWSDEHMEYLDPLITMLAEAGQKVITTTILDRAWNGQTYDAYKSMVKWTKKTDGTWSFNYEAFDKYVEFCMARGINKQISCFSMVPWGGRHYYFDEASGTDQYMTLQPNTQAYNEHWTRFLQNFIVHLEEKGWLGKTYIAMDERSEAEMQGVINLVSSISSELKLSMATNKYISLIEEVDDICFGYKKIPGNIKSLAEARRNANKTTTYYVCCADAHPNNFTYSPPAENVWLGWYSAKNNMDGSLRWAYNSWVENPLEDTRHSRFQAGDCFFVYPEARSSVRFERLREGIQDYEKIQKLRSVLSTGWQEQLETVLNTFTPSGNYTYTVNNGKQKLDWITKSHLKGDEPPVVRVNRAKGKPSEASTSESNHGRTPDQGNDGDTSSRWCASNDEVNQWWQVDLEEVYDIDEMSIMWEMAGKKYDFYIEGSLDGSTWSEIADYRDNTLTSQTQVISTTSQVRYLKLNVTGLSSGSWASFYEFKVHGEKHVANDNKAYNKYIEASSCECSYGRGAEKAVDGDEDTRWCASSGSTPQWLVVDLGQEMTINSYKIKWEFDNKKYDFIIEVSSDKTAWSQVIDKSDNNQTSQVQQGNFEHPVNARYVRLKTTGLQSGAWASLFELEIY